MAGGAQRACGGPALRRRRGEARRPGLLDRRRDRRRGLTRVTSALAAPRDAVPTARVPVPPVFGAIAWDDDFVTLADADLVIAPRTSVGLFRLIWLDMTHVDAFVGLGPAMRAHNAVTVPPQ